MNMVLVEGGSFTMGSPATEADRYTDETPHEVTLSPFYMGKYEITQMEWYEVMGTNPSQFTGEDLPVERVSWYETVEYCNRRSIKEGITPAYTIGKNVQDPNNQSRMDLLKWTVSLNEGANGYRLPTEAEWEYAARAGTITPFNTGHNITTDQANYDGDKPYNGNPTGVYRGATTAVGCFAPNAWGLYDMHGNVSEWVWDWYSDYDSTPQTDPTGAVTGADRVYRGGWWGVGAKRLRSAFRNSSYPSYGFTAFGFRVVRS